MAMSSGERKVAWSSTCYCARTCEARPLCIPVLQTLLDGFEIGRLGKEVIDTGLSSGMTIFRADEPSQGNDDHTLMLWQAEVGFTLTNCRRGLKPWSLIVRLLFYSKRR